MTNEQKIKAYLAAGHHVKVTILINNTITIVHDNWWRFVSSNGSLFDYDSLDDKIVEPLPLPPPPYKVWDKVIVLDIAVEMDWYDDFSNTKKWTVWKVWTITWICSDWTYTINGETFFPSWAIAPSFDNENDERKTKIQELESQLATIAKDLELLKK